MVLISIRGYAVVQHHGKMVNDPAILESLAGFGFEDDARLILSSLPTRSEAFISKLTPLLRPNVVTRFEYNNGDSLLTVFTEFRSRRRIEQLDLLTLVACTKAFWGEDEVLCQCPIHPEYDILCLWSKDLVREFDPKAVLSQEYPELDVIRK